MKLLMCKMWTFASGACVGVFAYQFWFQGHTFNFALFAIGLLCSLLGDEASKGLQEKP